MQKSRIQKWAPVLESDMGPKIKTRAEANIIATVLENQALLNKGALAESVNVTSDVQVYQQYSLPLVRRQFPELLAMNTVAVIPTTTPNGIYFALRYLYSNGFDKTKPFRQGQKAEIGYDLDPLYTAKADQASPFTTSEGEYLSNYFEQSNGSLGLASGAGTIKQASIKVIKGSIIVGTRAIKSHYTLELQQDLAAVHGQDVEALLLEALQFEIQQEIDREILAAMKWVATKPALGGETAITIDLSQINTATPNPQDGRWAAERIAGGIVNTIIAVAQKLSLTTRMGSGNFCIASPAVVAAIATINTGIYQSGYRGTDAEESPAGGVAAAGSLLNGRIKLYQDIYAQEDYALVGYKGTRQGESGIIFMPYIPYIFCKTAGQEDGSPRLIVKSRYAVVANLLGAGQFYRMVKFANINAVLAGFDITNLPSEFKGVDATGTAGGTYDPFATGAYGLNSSTRGVLDGVYSNGQVGNGDVNV